MATDLETQHISSSMMERGMGNYVPSDQMATACFDFYVMDMTKRKTSSKLVKVMRTITPWCKCTKTPSSHMLKL